MRFKVGLILSFTFIILYLLVIPRITSRESVQATTLRTYVENLNPKVFVIIYNPVLRSKGNAKIIDYKRWNNPSVLMEQYIRDVKEGSNGLLNYQLVGQIELDDIPEKRTGFDYTPEGLVDCLEGRGGCNGIEAEDMANYNKILSDNNICEKINKGEIDELWMFGGPRFGFYEANMAGQGGFWTNGPVITEASCQKPLHIMGYSYERGVSEMLHNLGHRIEGTLDTFIGYDTNNTGYGWKEYRSNKTNSFGLTVYGCGDIHFPPNATIGYQYDAADQVSSNCDDWLTYPNFAGATKSISCFGWNCTGVGFYKWWFKHIPHADGTDSRGKRNNWWTYISNASPQQLSNSPTPIPTGGSSPSPTLSPTTVTSPSPIANITGTITPSSSPIISPTASQISPSVSPSISPTPSISFSPSPTLFPTVPPRLPKIAPDPYPAGPFCPSTAWCPKKYQGDANCDGKIDMMDYKFWTEEFDTIAPAEPVNQNANFSCSEKNKNSHFVDLVDYEVWRRNVKNIQEPLPTPQEFTSDQKPVVPIFRNIFHIF